MTTTTTPEQAMTEALTDRYFKLARKDHTVGITPTERAELKRLSRSLGYKAYA